jgi:Trm5-related predicted tRNA methylase
MAEQKLSNLTVYDSINKMKLTKSDILLIKVNSYAESEEDMNKIRSSVQELSDILKGVGIKNPIVVLGPDADLSLVSEETLRELGYYKKDIPNEYDETYYD